MSLNAATIEMLLSKGLSGADILDVARALETKSVALSNAERQQRFRDKRKSDRNENNVTSVTPPNDNSNPPDYPTPETANAVSPPKSKKPRASKDGEPLPDDWQPILTDAAQEIVDRWPPGWLEARLAEFRDHARDKGRRSKDWQAAFRKWLSNADEWTRQKNGRSGQNFGRPQDRRDGAARALDRQLGFDEPPPDGFAVGGGATGGFGPPARLAAIR